ncbi:hypothetical protein [Bradyrhizobium sp. BR13661]|jgi:hypothetical protein|uniref:hypothetical protein n=1 Tax=Bradyrhizobium sp. BR13661 TaxID=2940622 RepID=UPI002473428B|nr:hypothetical protein [Bradyrhizobium sp. BR13661]MDH6259597.1 hypothetical protein [Bradyrhizobium sp. BR13661]
MKYVGRILIATLVIGASTAALAGQAAPADPKGKACRMEQQCRWENFKKICVYVKVCR